MGKVKSFPKTLGVLVMFGCAFVPPPSPTSKPAPIFDPASSEFPDAILFRTSHESFNREYYFLLHKGILYIKARNNSKGIPSIWQAVVDYKMSASKSDSEMILYDKIEQISMDENQLEIVYMNKIYTCNSGLSDYEKWEWDSSWGFPFAKGPGLELPSNYRSWSVSFSDPQEQKYQTDQNGNKFSVFVGSIFILSTEGTTIHIADPWTPADWGYQIATPARGRFIARNISASGSLVFIIDDYGNMFTKHVDFDVIGANPTLRYTYDTIPVHEGIYDRKYRRKLPIADWKRQPKIDGIISDRITVYSTGEGEKARNLRIAGQDTDGNPGFYEKTLTASIWEFIRAPVSLDPGTFLRYKVEGTSPPVQAESKDARYIGKLGDSEAVLDDFNLYCSPASLRIMLDSGNPLQLYLHTVFTFRIHIQRNPGTRGSPLVLKGVIEIPESTRGSTDPEIRAFLIKYFGYSKTFSKSRFIPIDAEASRTRIHVEKAGFFSIFSRLKIDFTLAPAEYSENTR